LWIGLFAKAFGYLTYSWKFAAAAFQDGERQSALAYAGAKSKHAEPAILLEGIRFRYQNSIRLISTSIA
jgi:hypothetical protein